MTFSEVTGINIDTAQIAQYFTVFVLFVLVVFLAVITRKVINLVLRRLVNDTTRYFLAAFLQLVIIVGGSYKVLIYAGSNPTVILALVAIFSAGLSLSADHSFKNLIAGLSLAASGRVDVNDYITVGAITGQVKNVGLLSTTLYVNSKGVVTLANSDISESVLINHTRLPYYEMTIIIPMSDGHDISACTDLIRIVLNKCEHVQKDKFKIVHDWTTGGETYQIVFRIDKYADRREAAHEVSEMITSSLRFGDFPIGVVSFYKQV